MLVIDDDAMEPRLRPGDIVHAEAVCPQSGELVLARMGPERVVRQLHILEHCRELLALVPLNPRWPVVVAGRAPIRILGKVVRIDHPVA